MAAADLDLASHAAPSWARFKPKDAIVCGSTRGAGIAKQCRVVRAAVLRLPGARPDRLRARVRKPFEACTPGRARGHARCHDRTLGAADLADRTAPQELGALAFPRP